MTRALIKSSRTKKRLYKHCKKSKDDGIKYFEYVTLYKKLIRISQHRYYEDKFKNYASDLRQTWAIINQLINKSTSMKSLSCLNINGMPVTDGALIVNHLNNYFMNVGPLLESKIPDSPSSITDYLSGNYMSSMVLHHTDVNEIINITSRLKAKHSFGFDGIPMSIIKSSIHNICNPLSVIINKSIDEGVFPDCLKVAKVCPLFKSGESTDVRNYRPISLLPCFSKIFEKVIYNRLSNYCDKHKILNPAQYGFRANHSTSSALIDLYDRISVAVEKGDFCIGVFIDLSKAFDTLNHEILIKKLKHYGIRGLVLDLFADYLKNRKQFVSLNGCDSVHLPISIGVPQGSVLGPLLFLIYINDIVNCSNLLAFILFADDTNLLYSCPDFELLQTTVNNELLFLANWFVTNRLSLNVSKTHYLMFGSKKLPVNCNISLCGNLLERQEVTKFLGVLIDSKLTWKPHIASVCSKISRGIGVINKLRFKLPTNILLNLYHSLVYSHLIYCIIIWGSACTTNLNPLFVLQQRSNI